MLPTLPARLWACLLATPLVFACSTSAPHPRLSDSVGDGSVLVQPGTDGSAAADGSADSGVKGDAAPGQACTSLGTSGSPVPMTIGAGPCPAPVGGMLAPGTYVLTSREIFPESSEIPSAAVPDGRAILRTFRFVDATVLEVAEVIAPAAGGPPTSTGSYQATYELSDSVMDITPICPPASRGMLTFSVVGSDLWLLTRETLEVYARQ